MIGIAPAVHGTCTVGVPGLLVPYVLRLRWTEEKATEPNLLLRSPPVMRAHGHAACRQAKWKSDRHITQPKSRTVMRQPLSAPSRLHIMLHVSAHPPPPAPPAPRLADAMIKTQNGPTEHRKSRPACHACCHVFTHARCDIRSPGSCPAPLLCSLCAPQTVRSPYTVHPAWSSCSPRRTQLHCYVLPHDMRCHTPTRP